MFLEVFTLVDIRMKGLINQDFVELCRLVTGDFNEIIVSYCHLKTLVLILYLRAKLKFDRLKCFYFTLFPLANQDFVKFYSIKHELLKNC